MPGAITGKAKRNQITMTYSVNGQFAKSIIVAFAVLLLCVLGTQKAEAVDDMVAQSISPSDNPAVYNDDSVNPPLLTLTFDGAVVNMGDAATLPVSTSQLEINWSDDSVPYDRVESTGAVPSLPFGGAPHPLSVTLSETFPIGDHEFRFNVDLPNEFPEADEDNASAWRPFTVRPSHPKVHYDWNQDGSITFTIVLGYAATEGNFRFDNEDNNDIVICPTLEEGWYCPGTEDIRMNFPGPSITVTTQPLNTVSSAVIKANGWNQPTGVWSNNRIIFVEMVRPSVDTDPATDVADVSLVLNGRINPNGNLAKGYFLYDTDPTNLCKPGGTGNVALFDGSDATLEWDSDERSFTATLTGLEPETTYYFCIVAENLPTPTDGGPPKVFGDVLSAETTERWPTVTLDANPTSIYLGEFFTLSWEVTDADACPVFGGDGFVDPNIPPNSFNDSQVITPTIAGDNIAYSLECSNDGGSTRRWVEVDVIAPVNPTIDSADRVVRPSDPNPNTDLNYDVGSSDPSSCTVTGPGGYNSGPLAFQSGTLWTHVTARFIFRIDCGGTFTDSATVDVVPLGWEN